MSIKSDGWIRRQARENGMIEPFEEKQVRDGVISFGLSSYGYDMRVSDEFRIFHNALAPVVDPKAFDERSFIEVQADDCIIPPNSFALARSVEYFRIPRNVLTPFEPEWEGHVTLEISNTTPLPARVYANEGIAQVLFFESDEVCETSYKDKKGKYQGQRGVTLPKL